MKKLGEKKQYMYIIVTYNKKIDLTEYKNGIYKETNDMFRGCVKLPNFDPTKVDKTNANTSNTGYLSLKA